MFEAIRFGERKKSDGRKVPQMTIDTSTFAVPAKVAAWSARNRWWVMLASVLVLVATVFVSGKFETKIYDGDGGEGESAIAVSMVKERFGDLTDDGRSTPTERLVVSNPSIDAKDPTYRATVEELVGRLTALREVESVSSYYESQDENLISEDGHVILAQIVFSDINVSDQNQVVTHPRYGNRSQCRERRVRDRPCGKYLCQKAARGPVRERLLPHSPSHYGARTHHPSARIQVGNRRDSTVDTGRGCNIRRRGNSQRG